MRAGSECCNQGCTFRRGKPLRPRGGSGSALIDVAVLPLLLLLPLPFVTPPPPPLPSLLLQQPRHEVIISGAAGQRGQEPLQRWAPFISCAMIHMQAGGQAGQKPRYVGTPIAQRGQRHHNQEEQPVATAATTATSTSGSSRESARAAAAAAAAPSTDARRRLRGCRFLHQVRQKGEGRQGLPQPHFIGEDAVQSRRMERRQPLHRLQLVGAQHSAAHQSRLRQ